VPFEDGIAVLAVTRFLQILPGTLWHKLMAWNNGTRNDKDVEVLHLSRPQLNANIGYHKTH